MPDNSVIAPTPAPLPLPLLLFHTDISVSLNVVLSRQELSECDFPEIGKRELPAHNATPKRVGFSGLHSSRHDLNLIAKPTGENGRPGRGGYNLEIRLKWPAPKWNDLKASMYYCLFDFIGNLFKPGIRPWVMR